MSYIPGSLKLVAGSLDLHIRRFASGKFPRTRIEGPALEYSVAGNPVQVGTFYEPKHLWEFDAQLTSAEWARLGLIYDYWLLTSPRPTLIMHDYTEPCREATQTRALATDATLDSLGTPSGWKSYYAQFAVFFLGKPEVTKDGRLRVCSLRLQELDKVAPV